MMHVFRIILVLHLVGIAPALALARENIPGRFDYYVLALSWSPSFCGTPSGEQESLQCGPGKRFAFVVHGFWPQFREGWPEYCPADVVWVPEQQVAEMMDIMPSRRLIIHQWRKHGVCSGLSQTAYFSAIRALREKLRIPARYLSPNADVHTTPEQLTRDFVMSNQDLTSAMLSVQCGNARDEARLAELRICLDRKGRFTPCGRNEERRCRAGKLILPKVRQ